MIRKIGIVVVIMAVTALAIPPLVLERSNPGDSGEMARLKWNRNADRIEQNDRSERIAIDSNFTLRGAHTKIYGGTFVGHDTVSLPLAYMNSDYVISPTLKYVYGDTPTAIIARPIDSSKFEVWLVEASDSNIIQWSTRGSMLGR